MQPITLFFQLVVVRLTSLEVLMQYTSNIYLQNRNGLYSTFKKLFFFIKLYVEASSPSKSNAILLNSLINSVLCTVTYINDIMCNVRYSQAFLIFLNYLMI